VTEDNVIIGMEMKDRKIKIIELEKEWRIEFLEKREVALIILYHLEHELNGVIDHLSDVNLKILLRWKGSSVSKMGNMVSKHVHYKKFVSDGTGGNNESNNLTLWTDDNENKLEQLITAPIPISKTAYGRFNVQKKRDTILAYEKMSPQEKSPFLQQCAKLDAVTNQPHQKLNQFREHNILVYIFPMILWYFIIRSSGNHVHDCQKKIKIKKSPPPYKSFQCST
jgi:hypothetical protein